MSWLRSKVHKVMEGQQNIKRFMENLGKLEEACVSCKAEEKIMLLRQLLASLKQAESTNIRYSLEGNDDKHKQEESQLISNCGLDHSRDEHLNFRDVFLRSHVVEGIVSSMILQGHNNDEESSLILEFLRLSIMGKGEDHDAIMSNIQELANVFSSYNDEELTRQDELLQYARVAIRGLEVNIDMERIDMEVSILQAILYENETQQHKPIDKENIASQENNFMTMEALNEALSKIRMHLKLEELLLQKKATRDGDCSETHANKVNKMKVLLESLNKSISKSETRIEEHRSHKDEAIRFRLAKATEVSKVEKGLEEEIGNLEKQKDKLEEALQKVNASLSDAKTSLHDVKEERDKFHEVNNVILYQLQLKDKELSSFIASCRSEAMMVTTLIRFVEDAWNAQLFYIKQLEKQTINDLETHSKYYAEMIVKLLRTYKVRLGNLVSRFRIIIRQLKASEDFFNTYNIDDESFPISVTRTSLEEDYLHLQAKLLEAFDLVECMKETTAQSNTFPRNEEKNVEELFNALENMKLEFQSLKRPSLHCQAQKQLKWKGDPIKLKPKNSFKNINDFSQRGYIKGATLDWNSLGLEDGTPEATSAKLSKSYFVQDINDWEFDAL